MNEREALETQCEDFEREIAKTQARIDAQGEIRDRLEEGKIDVRQAVVELLNLSTADLIQSLDGLERHVRVVRELLGGGS